MRSWMHAILLWATAFLIFVIPVSLVLLVGTVFGPQLLPKTQPGLSAEGQDTSGARIAAARITSQSESDLLKVAKSLADSSGEFRIEGLFPADIALVEAQRICRRHMRSYVVVGFVRDVTVYAAPSERA